MVPLNAAKCSYNRCPNPDIEDVKTPMNTETIANPARIQATGKPEKSINKTAKAWLN